MDILDLLFWLVLGHRDDDCGDDGPDSNFDDGPDSDVWKD